MDVQLQLPNKKYKTLTLPPHADDMRKEIARVGGSCKGWWISDPGIGNEPVYASDYFFVNSFYGDEFYGVLREYYDQPNLVIQIFARSTIDVRVVTDEERDFFVSLSQLTNSDGAHWIKIEPMLIPRTNGLQVFTESGGFVFTCDGHTIGARPDYLDIVARARGWSRSHQWTLYADRDRPTRRPLRVVVDDRPAGLLMPGLIEAM